MLAGYPPDQSEHKVALLERSWPDLPVVVSVQALLVDAGPAECQQPALFQQIDTVLTCFFCFFLVYGAEAVIPTDIEFDSPRVTMYTEEEAEEARQDGVNLLEEGRLLALSRSRIYQQSLR